MHIILGRIQIPLDEWIFPSAVTCGRTCMFCCHGNAYHLP